MFCFHVTTWKNAKNGTVILLFLQHLGKYNTLFS